MNIAPRATIGLPEPPASRPKLRTGIGHLLVHYTGVGGYAADPSKDLAYAKSVAYFGMHRNPPIPYEYNYLIGPGGGVFEQAGAFKGAHCLNFNPDSYGVLMMLGVGVRPTKAMCDSFVELRRHLVATGQLAPGHEVAPHYRYRSTACPGLTVADAPGTAWPSPTGEGRRGEVLEALRAPLDVITPDVEDDPMPTRANVRVYDSRMGDGQWQPGAQRNIPVAVGQMATCNLTVIPSGSGYLKAWKPGELEPATSVCNFTGNVVAGVVTEALTNGELTVKLIGGPAHVIVDTQVLWP